MAAEQGIAQAQYSLGLAYTDGKGVPQDDSKAVMWYRMAAEQGTAYAQNNLGSSYGKGKGVPQDDVLAYMWFSIAAAHGYGRAQGNRDKTARFMTPDQIAEAQRMTREWMAKHQQ